MKKLSYVITLALCAAIFAGALATPQLAARTGAPSLQKKETAPKVDSKNESPDTDRRDQGDAWLGVMVETLDKELAEREDIQYTGGAYVQDVVAGSPAASANIKVGDVIVAINGATVETASELIDAVSREHPKSVADLTIKRNSHTIQISATLGERQSDDDDYGFEPGGEDDDSHAPDAAQWKMRRGAKQVPGAPNIFEFRKEEMMDSYIGVTLQSVTDQLGDYFGLAGKNGALVSEVLDDSPAQKAGLKAGDVIVSIDGNDVASVSDIQEAIDSKDKGEIVKVGVIRNKTQRTLSVEVAERESEFGMMPHRWDFGPDGNGIPGQQFFRAPRMRGLHRGDMFDGKGPLNLEEQDKRIQALEEQLKALQEQIDGAKSGRPGSR